MNLAWDAALPVSQKFVLVSLADQSNDDGVCWPSVDKLAMRCSMNRRTVQRALSDLEDAGYIQRHERVGRSTWYSIGIGADGKGCFPVAKGGGTVSPLTETTGGGGVAPQGGGVAPPITTINPQEPKDPPYKPPQGGTVAKAAPPPGQEVYSAVFDDTWKSWPRGKGGSKVTAYKAWLKLGLDDPIHAHVVVNIRHDIQDRAEHHRQWLEGFVPHMATYLNQRQWTAPIDTSTGTNTHGRAKTPYEQLMEASERNRAALREDYDNMSDAEQREFRLAFGHG